MKYLLDTDTVSFALRGEGRVGQRLVAASRSDVCVSSITVAELRYGADLRRSRRLHGLIDDFLFDVRAVPFDVAAADEYGRLAAALHKRGVGIGLADALLAAHATSLAVAMVTRNVRHFNRVPGLRVESWY